MSNPNPKQQAEQQAEQDVSPPVAKQSGEKSPEKSRVVLSDSSTKIASTRLFGELAPLARVVSQATSVVDEETRLVASRSPLSALRAIAQQKEALLTQHDLQVLRLQGLHTKTATGDLSGFVSKLDQAARARLRALYARFEEALRQNGLRLRAAVASSEMLLAALSEAAQTESNKGPQLYTPQGRLSETGSVSFSRSVDAESEV